MRQRRTQLCPFVLGDDIEQLSPCMSVMAATKHRGWSVSESIGKGMGAATTEIMSLKSANKTFDVDLLI